MGRRKQEFRQLMSLPVERLLTPGLDAEAEAEAVPPPPTGGEGDTTRRPAPVLVAEDGEVYRVLVGRARVAAARRRGVKRMDCVVLEPACLGAAPVVERLQGGEFEPWELAAQLECLKSTHAWTQEQLGFAIGRTRDFVTNVLAICNIEPAVRTYLQEHPQGRQLTTRHLRYIGRTAPALQSRVARRILEERLSTKALESEVRRPRRRTGPSPIIPVRDLRKGAAHPRSMKEWRKYYRQLTTDLRRIGRREAQEYKRMEEAIQAAKARQRTIKREAREKRKALQAELRLVRRRLAES